MVEINQPVEEAVKPTVEKPIEPTEQPTEEPIEEFDEIDYNGEIKQIPKSERKTYLQKGYNYDKVYGRLTEKEQAQKDFADSVGMDLEEAKEFILNKKIQEDAEQLAIEKGLTEEEATEQIKENLRTNELEKKLQLLETKAQAQQFKAELKDKPFFNELEGKIDNLVADSIIKGSPINHMAAYRYLIGTEIEGLLKQQSSKTEQQTIANIQDQKKRGIVPTDSKKSEETVTLTSFGRGLASNLGISEQKIANRIKQNRS